MGRWEVMAVMAGLTLVGAARATGGASPRTAEGRQVVQPEGGIVVVKVADYDPAREKVLAAALRLGAEVLHSRTEVDFQGKKVGRLQLRLPAERLPLLLPAVHAVGKLYAESIRTRDETSAYEELGERIERLREHEQRLAALLQSPRRMRGSDILYLQERFFRASVDEVQLRQRRVDLERAARTATLVVELFEPEPRRVMDLRNWYAGSMLRARTALYRTVARGLTVGAYVLAFAPFWVPGLAIAFLLGRWLWRRGRVAAVRIAAMATLLASAIVARWAARSGPPRAPGAAAE